MKKTFKKIIASVTAVTSLAVGTVSMNVNASEEFTEETIALVESNTFNAGTYESSEEQYERFVNSDYATPEKIAKYEQMMVEHEAISNGTYITPRASVKRLGVPFYEQENSYYCGPATVRQVCGYFNGTDNLPSQSQIAKSLGTTSSNGTDQKAIIDYLNSKCSVTYETLWKNGEYTSAASLFSFVINDVSANKPTIAHITGATTSNWKYATSGHYLCYEGYADDTTTNSHVIYVVDPWLSGHKISNGKYSVSRDAAYTVTDRIGS